MPQTAIQLTTNSFLAPALLGITDQLLAAAQAFVEQTTDGMGYTDLEKRAMTYVEALKLSHGIDLTAMMARWNILNTIEREGLVGIHPGGYATLDEAARDNGISVSEMADTITLCGTVFPWLEEHGYSIAQLWGDIGKSGFREIAPVLKSLITGEPPSTQSALNAVSNALDNAAASVVANGGDAADNVALRTTAIDQILHLGATVPNRELRRALRPTRTPDISGVIIDGEGQSVVMLTVDQGQLTMVNRLLGNHLNVSRVSATQDAATQEFYSRVRGWLE